MNLPIKGNSRIVRWRSRPQPSCEGPESTPRAWSRIGSGGRNRECDLGAHSGLAPDLEMTADLLRALTHPRQAEVPGLMAVQLCCVDARAVVTDAQLKLSVIVPDLHLNPTSACVPERITQGLAADPIDVVTDDRPKVSWRALDSDIETGCVAQPVVALRRREIVTKRAERDSHIVGRGRGRAQALNSVSSLPDRARGLDECGLQPFFGFQRPIREYV